MLLRGQLGAARAAEPPPRPPWAPIDDAHFTALCTRCSECVRACPRAVLHIGDGGYPQIRFTERGCSLCGDCVRACLPQALRRVEGAAPWTSSARIGADCLARRRVECRVCGEACGVGAIRFRPSRGGVSQPESDAARCTGCGDCVAVCPAGAVSIQRRSAARA